MRGTRSRDRLFRALLRLFPAEFRGDFGEQMAADFDRLRQDAAGRPREVRRLWTRTVLDLLWRAPCEHAELLWRDAVYAVRALRRHPASTATAVLSLALGIGLNSAVFSVAHGVLWRELPFTDSQGLVQVGAVRASAPVPSHVPVAAYAEIQQKVGSLSAVGAWSFGSLTMLEPGEPVEIACPRMAENFLATLGASPIRGRPFTPAEHAQARSDWMQAEETPAPRAVILSHALWQRRFAGDERIVGRRIAVAGGKRVEIVGVMGPELESLAGLVPARGCWTPLPASVADVPGIDTYRGPLFLLGRLAAGRSPAHVQAELDTLKADLGLSFGSEPQRLHVLPLRDRLVQRVRPQLLLLLGVVLCVLLLTCANVANLSLARAAGRRDELVTRMALGAGHGRLVRQTITESLVQSVAGGACGFLLAVWAVPVLVASAPPEVPRLEGIGVSWLTFGFAAVVSALVGVCSGLVASLSAHRRVRLTPRSPVGAVSPHVSRLRQGLVVGEIAVALMLVVAATLMVRTVGALAAIDLGFDPSSTISASLPSAPGPFDLGRSEQLHTAAVERVRQLPGVVSAGVGIGPLSGGMFLGGLRLPGDAREFAPVRVDAVSPGYFQSLGVRLKAGRFFEAGDMRREGPAPILVNETAARMFWSSGNPIGRTLISNQNDEQVVIGVIGDLREASLESDPGPTLYQLSSRSRNFLAGSMLIRVDGNPDALLPAIRDIVRSINPEAPFNGVASLQDRIDRATAPRRFVLQVIGLFSVLGLMLAVIGIYGVVAEFVAQRVPEIGVRMACGATVPDLVRLVLRQGWRLAIIGVVLGLVGAGLARGAMSQMVYGVQTLDPIAYGIAALCLLGASIAACAIPAARASRLDPITALRLE